jgi:hypothetical protein
MNTRKWIALGIALIVILAAMALIKFYPLWVTISCLVAFIAGTIAGYVYKGPEIITKIVEKIVEVPAKPKTTKKKTKKVE